MLPSEIVPLDFYKTESSSLGVNIPKDVLKDSPFS